MAQARVQQSFVKGAAILGLAAFLSKILGAVYRIPYQNITGNEGMYVYQQVYPLYSALLLLATAGFPIAISKMVSEKLALGDTRGAKRIFWISLVMLVTMGGIFFICLYLGAGQVAEWMGSRHLLTLPIQAVSFALLVVPIVSALRGYFQGYQNMLPTAASQVTEQLIRVTTILFLSWYFIDGGYGYVYAGAGAVFGAFTGAIAALVMLLIFWNKHKEWEGQVRPIGRFRTISVDTKWQIAREIWAVSIPICLSSLVLPLYSLVDSFTVGNLLTASGWAHDVAIAAKGIYDRGQPLIQFASFFASAVALSIVPAIAEARMHKNHREADKRATLALRLTWLLGLPASVGLAIIALPTNVMLFKDAAGSSALAILAFAALFSTLKVTSSAILQGSGNVYLPVINLFIGVTTKWLLNLWLIPLYDINGAAIATVVAYGLAAGLNMLGLRKMVRLKGAGFILRNGLAISCMALTVWLMQMGTEAIVVHLLPYRTAMMVTALSAVAVGAVVYGLAVLRFGLLTRDDLEAVPKLKRKLLPMLDKWQLIRS